MNEKKRRKKTSLNQFRADIRSNIYRLIRSYLKAHFMRAPANLFISSRWQILWQCKKENHPMIFEELVIFLFRPFWALFIIHHHNTQMVSKRSSMFECRWLKLNVTYLIRKIGFPTKRKPGAKKPTVQFNCYDVKSIMCWVQISYNSETYTYPSAQTKQNLLLLLQLLRYAICMILLLQWTEKITRKKYKLK